MGFSVPLLHPLQLLLSYLSALLLNPNIPYIYIYIYIYIGFRAIAAKWLTIQELRYTAKEPRNSSLPKLGFKLIPDFVHPELKLQPLCALYPECSTLCAPYPEHQTQTLNPKTPEHQTEPQPKPTVPRVCWKKRVGTTRRQGLGLRRHCNKRFRLL